MVLLFRVFTYTNTLDHYYVTYSTLQWVLPDHDHFLGRSMLEQYVLNGRLHQVRFSRDELHRHLSPVFSKPYTDMCVHTYIRHVRKILSVCQICMSCCYERDVIGDAITRILWLVNINLCMKPSVG